LCLTREAADQQKSRWAQEFPGYRA
jgi:hypothetical protein